MIGLCYYFENILGFLIMVLVPNPGLAYWIATAHPMTRLPVFFMGICAGVICNRIQNEYSEEMFYFIGRSSDNWILSFIEDNFLPLPFLPNDSQKQSKDDAEKRAKSWKRRVDVNMFYYLAVLFSLAIWNIITTTIASSNEDNNRTFHRNHPTGL